MENSEKYKYFLDQINRANCPRKKSAAALSIKMSFQCGELTSNEQFELLDKLNMKK